MVGIFFVLKDNLRGQLSAVITKYLKGEKQEKNGEEKTTQAKSFSGKVAGQSLSNVEAY